MLTGKKSKARCHSITIRLVLQNQPFPPVFQDMAPDKSRLPALSRRNGAGLPKQEENVTQPEHKGGDGILLLAR